jgi:creatinine amidohydrolase/Fe(II)-dependent formamide hydrolase-like protein
MNLAAQIAKREFNVMVATPHGPSDTELAKKIEDRMDRHFEVHSGPRETAYALHYFPELVEMWRLENWENGVVISEELQEFMDPDREDFELVNQVFHACLGPNTEDITRTGQYATSDPRDAEPEEAAARMEEIVNFMVDFIELWKSIPIPACFRD